MTTLSFTDDVLDREAYGIPLELGSFTAPDVPLQSLPVGTFDAFRTRIDSLLKKHWSCFPDNFDESDVDAERLADVLDAISNHEWIGNKTDGRQSLHRPLDAIAAACAGPVLDLSNSSLLARLSQWSADEARKGYFFAGKRKDLERLPAKRLLSDLRDGVKFVADVDDFLRHKTSCHSVYLGTRFHEKISTTEGRTYWLKSLQKLQFRRAYFVFPDPLGFAYGGFLSRRETEDFAVQCCYPCDESCIDGALDIKVLGRTYWDPLIKKRNIQSLARPLGLDVLFFRADQFVNSVFPKEKGDYDRLILQNYCVGVFKPRADPFALIRPSVSYSFGNWFSTPTKGKEARLPQSCKGMPLPRNAVPHYVMGDVFVAEKIDGVPFWGYLEGRALVFHVEGRMHTITCRKKLPFTEVELYGECVETEKGLRFVIYDVYSFNHEINLPFYERWNKMQYGAFKWEHYFPGVTLQEYVPIQSPQASTIISNCKEGIVLIHADSVFGSFSVDGQRFFYPARYVKRQYTVDVEITELNLENFEFRNCKYAGSGVYECDEHHRVLRKHKESRKKANGQGAIRAIVEASSFEYFVAMRDAVMLSFSLEKVLSRDRKDWWKVFGDPVVYLTYPAPYTYIGFSRDEIVRLERIRSGGYSVFMNFLSVPSTSSVPKPITLDDILNFMLSKSDLFDAYKTSARFACGVVLEGEKPVPPITEPTRYASKPDAFEYLPLETDVATMENEFFKQFEV